MRNSLLLLTLLFHLPLWVVSQGSIGSFSPDETVFYAQTKQMNQFFLRFNGEEDLQGKRLYPGDAGYHDIKARKGFNLGASAKKAIRHKSVVMMIFLFPALLIFLAGPGFLALGKGLMSVYG